jgi:hypothetical protein
LLLQKILPQASSLQLLSKEGTTPLLTAVGKDVQVGEKSISDLFRQGHKDLSIDDSGYVVDDTLIRLNTVS